MIWILFTDFRQLSGIIKGFKKTSKLQQENGSKMADLKNCDVIDKKYPIKSKHFSSFMIIALKLFE